MTSWRPDILGSGFECTDIDLGHDDEGELIAALVRALPQPQAWWKRLLGRRRPLEGTDVLYVHGWSDYFFQRRLAHFWNARGASFYALDLRKYGRSLRPGQTPGYIGSLDDYDAEIGLALELIAADRADSPPQNRRLVLMGHSTGGLVLSLWADRHPGIASALILNSPWLEFQLTSHIRQMIAPIIDLRARINPREAGPQLDFGFYSRAQHEVADDTEPVDVNTEWRPERAHTVSAGWFRAVLQGQTRVAKGLHIAAPVCVLLSARSATPIRWGEELTRADTVLDVDEVAKAALVLGSSVTIERIDGALHDVFLSRRDVRTEAYARLERWVSGWAAAHRGQG